MESTECDYMSPQQIAARYGFDQTAVYRWILYGVAVGGHEVKLRAMKVGKSWRVTVAGWEEFLKLCNPDHWRAIAELQERERKEAAAQAGREDEELARELGPGRGRRKR